MTEITGSPTAGTTTVTQTAAEAASKGAKQAISSDFETFLKMLTTQLENQDPLNPMEATEFAVQLATFSGVEQQVQTNDLLGELTGQFGLMGMSNLAGWIGKEALVSVPAYYGGTPLTLDSKPDANAARAELAITDSEGVEIERFEIPITAEQLEWSGLTSTGDPRPWGEYGFSITSYAADGSELSETVPQHFARIAEVRMVEGKPSLVVSGGSTVDPDEVSAVR